MIFTQQNHIIPVLAPLADRFDTSVETDIISMKNAEHVTFFVGWGVGATGTQTITVDACSTITATATTAVAFNYKALNPGADWASATDDTWGALTAATNAGFTTTAGSYRCYAIEVNASVIAATGYEFVRLAFVEVANSAVLGFCIAILSGIRHQGDTLPEAIS